MYILNMGLETDAFDVFRGICCSQTFKDTSALIFSKGQFDGQASFVSIM